MLSKFVYRIFDQGSDRLLAISDSAIIGRTLRSKDLELTVSREFYHDKSCDESKALELVGGATIVNAIGKDIVDLLAKKGIVDNKSVLLIGEIPHAQVIAFK